MSDRYGNVRIAKIMQAYNDLRQAVRAHDASAAETALDRYEQWADYAFGVRPPTLTEALALPEVAALVKAATPYVSPMQNADYARQLRQHDALVAALAALKGGE
jgi:hypothetical protein